MSERTSGPFRTIRSVLSGSLSRCTGYIPIIEAVLEARASYRKADKR
jgi:carbon-monoxide dehydrogenase small subunit